MLMLVSQLAGQTEPIEKLLTKAIDIRRSNVDSSIYLASLALDKAREDQNPLYIGKSLGTLAESYTTKGENSQKVIQYLNEAAGIFKSLKENELLGRIYIKQGLFYDKKGEYKAALSFYFKAYGIFEGLTHYEGLEETTNNIGVVYELLEDTGNALKYYNQSLEFAKQTKKPIKIGGAYANLGGFYENIADYTAAKKYLNLALEFKQSANDWAGISRIYNNLGRLYYTEGDTEKGINYFKQSLELKKKYEMHSEIASSYYNLGYIEEDRGKFKQAELYYEQSYEWATKFNDLPASLTALGGLINVYDTLGEYKKAVKMSFQYIGLNDSLFNLEKSKQVLDLKEKYESDKKEKEILLQKERLSKAQLLAEKNQEESKRKTAVIIGALCALGLMVALLVLVFRNYKQKQKANIELADKNKLIEFQKDLVEEKHKEITDSINYAERIQRSFMATTQLLNDNLKDHFVFFQPKDVVSGDFYWASVIPGSGFEISGSSGTELNQTRFALVTADSTGHGVPGAIMSILNISCLEKSIDEKRLTEPAEILNHTRTKIIERLSKDGSADGGKDGMDCSLVVFDFNNSQLTYAAANNPVWVVRNKDIVELAPDKMPVGKHDKDKSSFTQHTVNLLKGDVVYTITDGMPDQFGGPKGKKFMYKQLKQLLITIANLPMPEQKQELMNALNSWKGNNEQVDDVLIIGVRV